LKVGFTSNLWTDAVFFETATGGMAQKDEVKGVFNVFSSSQFKGNELRLTFAYTGSHFDGFLELKGDNLVTRGTKFFQETDPAYDTGDIISALLTGENGKSTNTTFAQILNEGFGDYWVKGTAGIFTGYVGNTANRGKMEEYRFADYTDFIRDKIENYGAIKIGSVSNKIINYGSTVLPFPDPNGSYNARAWRNMAGGMTDTDNLKMGAPYASFSIGFSSLGIPLVIDLASSLDWNGANNSPMPSYTDEGNPEGDRFSNYPAMSYSSIAGAFRVSGGKFADFISFDAIYKIKGMDPNTLYNGNNPVDISSVNPRWNNEIGLYAGLDLFSGFQIGVGYTAAFTVDESMRRGTNPVSPTNDRDTNRAGIRDGAVIEKSNPLFSGIDLRLKLTMIPNLAISLNNNLSFAFQQGKNDIQGTGGGTWVEPMGAYLPDFGLVKGAAANEQPDWVPGFLTAFGVNGANPLLQGIGIASISDANGNDIPLYNMNRSDQKDSWFALWNSLGVSYDITQKVKVSFALSNRLGVYEFTGQKTGANDNEENSAKYVTDDFQAAIAGFYNFSSNVMFAAGLHLGIWGTQADVKIGNDDNKIRTGKIGEVMFAIPIQFKVSW
jgi:hypothetical protein